MRGAVLLSASAVAGPFARPAPAPPTRTPAKQEQPTRRNPGAAKFCSTIASADFRNRRVVNHFSDEIIKDPVAGAQSKNPALREWHTKQLGRLPGLKFMRALWVAKVSGGPLSILRRGREAPISGSRKPIRI